MSHFEPRSEDPYRRAMLRDAKGFTANIDQEIERFDHILGTALEESEYKRPLTGILSVLDVACGYCYEAPALANRFGHMNLTGIDINADMIEVARERIKGMPGNHEFIIGDAGRLTAHRDMPAKVDVAVIRRQNIFNIPRAWENIFNQTMQRLTTDGLAIVTSLTDIEHDMMTDAFSSLGYDADERVSTLTPYHENTYGPNTLGTLPIDYRIAVFHKYAS
jgi:SAM-dependent methyltransferase